ncbi:MAG: hypothetical protein ACN4EH_03260, partial [Methyloceanibacter sp.]
MTISSLNLVFAGTWGRFIPYSGLHLVTICVCVLAVASLGGIGRALSDTRKTDLRRALGVFAIAYWVVSYTMLWYRHGLDLPSGLPLHICELNNLIAPL